MGVDGKEVICVTQSRDFEKMIKFEQVGVQKLMVMISIRQVLSSKASKNCFFSNISNVSWKRI